MESKSEIKLSVGDSEFLLERSKIPKNSYFDIITTDFPSEEKYILSNVSELEFKSVFEYLQNGTLPNVDHLEKFDYFGIDMTHSYQLASLIEEDMRKNMYSKEFPDKYHGLAKINLGVWNDLILGFKEDSNLLFNSCTLQKNSWDKINQRLELLRQFTALKGVFVAGGCIFSILFDKPIKDIDIFLCGLSQQEAKQAIMEISKVVSNHCDNTQKIQNIIDEVKQLCIDNQIECEEELKNIGCYLIERKNNYHGLAYNSHNNLEGRLHVIDNDNEHNKIYDLLDTLMSYINYNVTTTCTRTANAITFVDKESKLEVQVILRLYQSPSEVIHGFDVDSCCFGFDGESLWMTHRAHYAIKNGYNTVNFDRLSPSYEMRLVKYGTRGMPIKIPNFNRKQVDHERLEEYFKVNKPEFGGPIWENYGHIKSLTGADLLIYFEYHCDHSKYRGIIDKLNKEFSDYNSIPLIHYGGHEGNIVERILEYLKNTKDNFPELSKNYMPYIREIESLSGYEINDYEADDREDIAVYVEVQKRLYGDREDITFEEDHVINSEVYKILTEREELKEKELVVVDPIIQDQFKRAFELRTNNIPKAKKMWLLKGDITSLDLILDIPESIYKCLECVRPWNFSGSTTFKTTNPGEQMTNTFHQIVLEDNDSWYNGLFYIC
jgi:hypothetical protein